MNRFFLKDRVFVFFFVCLFSSLIALLTCLLLLLKIEKDEIRNSKEEFESYLLADQFRQSSDDLTKMSRLYVLTGDVKYFKWYQEILAIRKGIDPLPEKYNEIYWDLVLNDSERPRASVPPIALLKAIKDHKFPSKEMALLTEAELHSDQLSEMEIEGMYAVSGKFKDASGLYSIQGLPDLGLARQLVSGPRYMQRKAEVMRPLQEFYDEMTKRLNAKTEDLTRENNRVVFISIVLLICSALFIVLSLWRSLRSLSKVSESNENLLLSSLPSAISDRFKQGKDSTIKECEASVLFVDIGSFEEGKSLEPSDLLEDLFEQLDQMTLRFGVERIKTVQGSYMVVAGISTPMKNHMESLADFALALRAKVKEFGDLHKVSLYARVGMAAGTVITGVLDHKKYIYDLWGDVLKVASRLESIGVKGEILITKKMAMELKASFEVVEKDALEKSYLLKQRLPAET